MLQQTQVSAVRESFRRWMRDFPTVESLAKASEEDVLAHWQGLGYYSRARNIHKTAQAIVENGQFPQTRKALESLKGIGPYTAGAILSLAFHQNEAILDGNLIRIFSRLREWDFLPTDGIEKKDAYWEEAKLWAKAGRAHLTNEALMELGRTVCKKSGPRCTECPLREACRAFRSGTVENFPPRTKARYESWTGFALVVRDSDGNFLLQSSPDSPFLKNQRIFPLLPCESVFKDVFPGIAETVVPRENIKRFAFTGTVKHSITRYKIHCRVLCAEVSSPEGIPGEWVSKRELPEKLVSSLAQKILVLAHDF